MRHLLFVPLVFGLSTCASYELVQQRSAAVVAPPERVPVPKPHGWAPPTWFSRSQSAFADGSTDALTQRLWVLDDLNNRPEKPKRGPSVRAASAIVADLDKGEVLWAKDPDSPRSIASVTKLVSSLALMSTGADLDRKVCVTLEQWPTRPGARSKFETGDCVSGWELLGAALIASDNRGAFSMPAIADEDYYVFVDRMRSVAADLGLTNASFVDPAGLEDENMASARDVLKAVVAVSMHPILQTIASAPSWEIETHRGPRELATTNRILATSLLPARDVRTRRHVVHFEPPPYETVAAKTGYTDTAHYCFATVVRSLKTGRLLAATVLGAPTSSARFDDVEAMLAWADSQ
jgi:D-alanyl-D-alanine endopeptidase (penicillin-binding protein 7)